MKILSKSFRFKDNSVYSRRSIQSSESKPYVVRYGWDDGGPENGPSYGYGEDIVYALSEQDACNKWESENEDYILSLNDRRYGGYEGCFARVATDEDIREYQEFEKSWDDIENDFYFIDDGDN